MTTEALDSRESTIVDYIRTLTPPLSRDSIYRHLREMDSTITRGDISRALRDMGFVAKRMRGDTPSGVCQRWVRMESKDSAKEREGSASVSSEVMRVTETNANLTDERGKLVELVQRSVQLKKDIREQQKQLLLEMSALVQSMYGDSDAEH